MHRCGGDLDDSVGIYNYFSIRRVGEFRKVTTGGGKFRQSFDGHNNFFNLVSGIKWRVGSNIIIDIFKVC